MIKAEERISSAFVNLFLGMAALGLLLLLIEERKRNLVNAQKYCEQLFENVDEKQFPPPIKVRGSLNWDYDFPNLLDAPLEEIGNSKYLFLQVKAPNHPEPSHENSPTLQDLVARGLLEEKVFDFRLSPDLVVELDSSSIDWQKSLSRDRQVYGYTIFANENLIDVDYPDQLDKVDHLAVFPVGLAPNFTDFREFDSLPRYAFRIGISEPLSSTEFKTFWEDLSNDGPGGREGSLVEPYWQEIRTLKKASILAYFNSKLDNLDDELKGTFIPIANLRIDAAFVAPVGPIVLSVLLLIFWSRLKFMEEKEYNSEKFIRPMSIPVSSHPILRLTVWVMIAASLLIVFWTSRIHYNSQYWIWNHWEILAPTGYAILSVITIWKHWSVTKKIKAWTQSSERVQENI